MVPTIVAGGVLVVLPVSVVAGAACVGGVLVCCLCRWCPRVLPVSVVSSCAPCVRGVLVVLPGVLVVLPGVGGGWCCLCRWCPRVLPVSVVSSWCSLVSVVSSSAYSQPDTQAGTRKALQCGGAFACESKLQGEIDGHNCSNYQLFRCSSWGSFYRLVDKIKH